MRGLDRRSSLCRWVFAVRVHLLNHSEHHQEATKSAITGAFSEGIGKRKGRMLRLLTASHAAMDQRDMLFRWSKRQEVVDFPISAGSPVIAVTSVTSVTQLIFYYIFQ